MYDMQKFRKVENRVNREDFCKCKLCGSHTPQGAGFCSNSCRTSYHQLMEILGQSSGGTSECQME